MVPYIHKEIRAIPYTIFITVAANVLVNHFISATAHS